MQRLLYCLPLVVLASCQLPLARDTTFIDAPKNKGSAEMLIADADTVIAPMPRPYSRLIFQKKELLNAAPGTKSVLFNSTGSRLYAMNLEGMSVYEFDRPSRNLLREFRFRPTKGIGWNYATDKPIPSYEEKPVEACFTNNDRILWVSLHNAGGIVPIPIDSSRRRPFSDDSICKHITVIDHATALRDSFDVPLVRTGKTPKVISRTADEKYLLVSNWHSYTVSVLAVDANVYPYAKVIRSLPVSAIPRGIAVDDRSGRSYVAIMGGASIAVLDNTSWEKEDVLHVESNPRHLVVDSSGRLFVSYNKLAKVACVDQQTGKTLFSTPTHLQPRTIALSKNKQFLFVTCYSGNTVDVFGTSGNHFQKLYSIPCPGKPVGVDLYEDDEKLEAWVCTYTNGSINILSFLKSY
jgi:DNA-binding beta-propeller fold protein YncE